MKDLIYIVILAIVCYFYAQEWSRNSDYVLRLEDERDNCYYVLQGERYK